MRWLRKSELVGKKKRDEMGEWFGREELMVEEGGKELETVIVVERVVKFGNGALDGEMIWKEVLKETLKEAVLAFILKDDSRERNMTLEH